MLSYQHAFHAGNHADVLKHLSLLALLDKLQQKDKPYFYLDTHAGEGCYSISSENNNESVKHDQVMATAFLKNEADAHPIIQRYQTILDNFVSKGMYPGSPLILDAIKRDGDNMHVNELHPQAFETLRTWTKQSGIQSHNRNAFELLNAMMPPKPNRGLVLIDPPYEQVSEYSQLVNSVAKAIKVWPQGIIAIWYPLLSPTRLNRSSGQEEINPKSGLSEKMLGELSKIATNGLLDIRFAVQAPSTSMGMYGSGIAIINPPWLIEDHLSAILQAVEITLKQDENTLSKIEFLVERT